MEQNTYHVDGNIYESISEVVEIFKSVKPRLVKINTCGDASKEIVELLHINVVKFTRAKIDFRNIKCEKGNKN